MTENGPFVLGAMIQLKSYKLPVDKNTVGEFTGMHDKNSKDIYEGDIIEWDGYRSPVEFSYGSFVIRPFHQEVEVLLSRCDEDDILVLGNIYENPDLLSN